MSKPRRARFVALADLLARRQPTVDPDAIRAGRVLVDGRVLSNPDARARTDAAVRVLPETRLRGDVKLSHALDTLAVPAGDRTAVDVGAAAGGFTTALLRHGARRVYAVDVGSHQLRGRLRQDPRVVDLERHNLAVVDRSLVPDPVDLVTLDLSYLSVAGALPHLERLRFAPGADLVALVKPTFELHRPTLAARPADVAAAVRLAAAAAEAMGWTVLATCPAPRTGRRGAREVFLHAHRRPRPLL
ncbi:MAG TPA: SAM-dependent methyltransferase [Acidimicrobiales bacterium]|jgi:23S rRNA (cytidine1920-2'-O)/16S rRNA (cytidine1409-2'-O)-methyltransferase